MGNVLNPCTTGCLNADRYFNDAAKWWIGLNWTVGGGLAQWAFPSDATSYIRQDLVWVADHLYQSKLVIDDIHFDNPNHGVDVYLSNQNTPIYKAAGTYFYTFHKTAPPFDFFTLRVSWTPSNAGDFVKCSELWILDITCTLANLYGFSLNDWTLWEYWLLADNKIMIKFVNNDDGTNILAIWDPATF